MISVPVAAKSKSYSIDIAPGLLQKADWFKKHIVGKQVCIVTNETVAPLYLEALKAQLSDFEFTEVILRDGEQYKTLEQLMNILERLMERKATRKTTVIALGGGVIGDMSGLAASLYQRGVPLIQIPTTLLSQVDSSVGGKTAVNHPMGKNMIGAFYQPNAVLIDPDTLKTLPDREYAAGLAEVIKYGFIYDADFLAELYANVEALQAKDEAFLARIIQRSCEIKAAVVEEDETETGIRAILNFGHTFGHAVETLTHYKQFLHGEAIAIGMMIALRLSIQEYGLDAAVLTQLEAWLKAFDLPTELPKELSADDMLEAMSRDKKNVDGDLRLVLLDQIGHAMVRDGIPKPSVIEVLS